jgi:hypothetical protein
MSHRVALTVGRYRGEYELDVGEPFTNLEWRWIKKISGYLPDTLEVGLIGRDPDVYVAFAIIAMARAGRIRRDEALMVAEALDDLPNDGAALRYIIPEVDADDPPPGPTAATGQPTTSTGGSSSATSGRQEPHQKAIGAPA